MIISIDPRAAIPPYEQIRAQIAEMIEAGRLARGERLPAVRQLAGDLGLAPGTVARAYRELENDGFLRSRGPRGTFVSDDAPRLSAADRRRKLDDAAKAFADATRRLGIPSTTAIDRVQRALG
jgi:DNA-binding transcriptional regulator YhcF (GntR family)